MLGLKLRVEFRGKRLRDTAIELSKEDNSGATQIAAREFLEITYPTHDLVKGIEAVGPDQGRPIVVIGEKGLGKSHLLAALYHTVNDPASTRAWLQNWSETLKEPSIAAVPLRQGMMVIGESLHRQRYKYLWDVLFENHPHGKFIRGKWEGQGEARTDVPSDQLMVELFTNQPTLLILDEYQTWFDGLTNTKQHPRRNWAFNFIQILSDIAEERPDLLVLVVSVRNGQSDAYQQIHRKSTSIIDFKAGGSAERIQRDRRNMLLHRLFENRRQVDPGSIEAQTSVHIEEFFRLASVPSSEHDRRRAEFIDCWPFAPHLLRLLEEQVLIATDAQEARDLIRVLAILYKNRGEKTPLLTAADFRLNETGTSSIGALLDSVANEHHRTLRAKAHQNITSVTEAIADHQTSTPHLDDILSALWLRSIASGNQAGAEPATLQVDITRGKPIDDNSFQVELSKIIENSFNIHEDGRRLVFREEENPKAKVMAAARNAKLFMDGSDLTLLRKTTRHVIAGADEVARAFRVIALPKRWKADPWAELDETERPEKWDARTPILILPEDLDNVHQQLGPWLKEFVPERRNTVRYLLPRADSINAYEDPTLLLLARATLKAQDWSGQGPDYKSLATKFTNDLRDALKKRFDRFAVLIKWNFSEPRQCQFWVQFLKKHGEQVPEAIDEAVRNNLFAPEDLEDLVKGAAQTGTTLGKLIRELQEPRPAGFDCVPWLGETPMKEHIGRLCARGEIAVNARDMELLQAQPGEDEETAWKRLRSKFSFSGRQMDEVKIELPHAVPTTGGSAPEQPSEIKTGVDPPSYPVTNGFSSETADNPLPNPTSISNIFATSTVSQVSVRKTVAYTSPATSPLNLMGRLEAWGIGPATPVEQVSLRVSAATGAQLKELLKKLPDGMTFELGLERVDG